MYLLLWLNNILFLIFLLFLSYQVPYLQFLVFRVLSISLLMKRYMFLFHLFLQALNFLDYLPLLHINYMPIYNFVHNPLSLHFYKPRNHLRNIFLNNQSILHHVQTFLLPNLLVCFASYILFVLCLILWLKLLFLPHFYTKT